MATARSVWLISDDAAGHGGVERGIIEIGLGLAQLGWRPVVIVPSPGAMAQMAVAAGLQMRVVSLFRRPRFWRVRRFLPLDVWIRDACGSLTAKRMLRRDKVALMLCAGKESRTVRRWAGFAQRMGVPIIWSCHDTNPSVLTHCTPRLTNLLERTLAVSGHVKSTLLSAGLNQADKITVVYNGLDLTAWDAQLAGTERTLREELGIPRGRPVVGLVARLDPIKGQKIFLQAAELVIKERPDVLFVLVGLMRPASRLARFFTYYREVRKLARSKMLRGHVLYTGWRTQMAPVMQALDIVVQPSLRETFGRTLIEAMATRKPVIASRVGGMPEVVVEGRTGLLVPPDEPQALAQAVVTLLDDPERRRLMGEEGRRVVEERFRLETRINTIATICTAAADYRQRGPVYPASKYETSRPVAHSARSGLGRQFKWLAPLMFTAIASMCGVGSVLAQSRAPRGSAEFGPQRGPGSSLPSGKVADFQDPIYGGKIRQMVTPGNGHNLYYHRNPWNADNSRLIGIQSDDEQRNWSVVLYDGEGRFLKPLFTLDQYDWRLVWDRNNPDILYTWRGSEVYRFHVSSGKADLLKSFAPLFLKPNGTSVNQQGDRILVLTSDNTFRSFHLPDMSDERDFTAKYPAGCLSPSKNERYTGYRNQIVTQYGSPDFSIRGLLVYNDDGRLVRQFNGIGGGGHYDFSPAGELAYFTYGGAGTPLEIHVAEVEGSGDRVVFRASGAETAHLQDLHLSWPDKIPDWFVASFFPSTFALPDKYQPLLDEIAQIQVDGTHRFLARSGTSEGVRAKNFWAEPLGSPSADGSRVSFNSNVGGNIQQYILRIR